MRTFIYIAFSLCLSFSLYSFSIFRIVAYFIYFFLSYVDLIDFYCLYIYFVFLFFLSPVYSYLPPPFNKCIYCELYNCSWLAWAHRVPMRYGIHELANTWCIDKYLNRFEAQFCLLLFIFIDFSPLSVRNWRFFILSLISIAQWINRFDWLCLIVPIVYL